MRLLGDQQWLEAMERRLEAKLLAAKRVQPALDEFYALLSSEQLRHNHFADEVIE